LRPPLAYSDTTSVRGGGRSAIEETLAYYAFPEEHWRQAGRRSAKTESAKDSGHYRRRRARGSGWWLLLWTM